MKRAIWLVIPVAVLFAVSYPWWKPVRVSTTKTVIAARLTDEQKLSLLNGEVIKRHLRYKIFCTSYYTDEKEEFEAVAEHIESTPGAMYEDEGRMDEWMVTGPTMADAAYALYDSIRGDPTHAAKQLFVREKDKPRTKRQCPSIKGNWQYQPPKKSEKSS